jgi:hypothetical protein
MARPEQYGAVADGVTNCAEAINKCLIEHGSCELGDGVYQLGAPGADHGAATLKSVIFLAWGDVRGRRLTGNGPDRTIVRNAPDTSAKRDSLYHRGVFMVKSGGPTFQADDCADALIQGITFDGNYDAQNQDLTMSGINVTGSGTRIIDCDFTGFGVGVDNQESFIILTSLPLAKGGSKGTEIRRCRFGRPGRNRRRAAAGSHIEALTSVAFGGNMASGRRSTGDVVAECTFTGDVGSDQTSPLHGVTPHNTVGAVISQNLFQDYQGNCFYVDTGFHGGTRFVKNKAVRVPSLVQLTSHNIFRIARAEAQADPERFMRWIGHHVDMVIEDNEVELSGPESYFWQPSTQARGWNPMVVGYNWDRDFGQYYREDNSGPHGVVLGCNRYKDVADDVKLFNIGGWMDGSFQYGIPNGPVSPAPGIREDCSRSGGLIALLAAVALGGVFR